MIMADRKKYSSEFGNSLSILVCPMRIGMTTPTTRSVNPSRTSRRLIRAWAKFGAERIARQFQQSGQNLRVLESSWDSDLDTKPIRSSLYSSYIIIIIYKPWFFTNIIYHKDNSITKITNVEQAKGLTIEKFESPRTLWSHCDTIFVQNRVFRPRAEV